MEIHGPDPLEVVTESPVPATVSPSRWRTFLRARFSREGAVGLYLTVGFLGCAVLIALFGLLADSVFDLHGSTPFDREITLAIQSFQSPARDRLAHDVSFFGDHRFLLPATLLVTAILAWRQQRVSALLFSGAVIGGWLLETLLKIIYHRARPALWPALVSEKTYSFPSGHATMSTLFYGTVAALILHLSRNGTLRAAVLALATVIVLSICSTRIYLGAHWTTDVLAGILVGLFWVVVCATGTEFLARRKPRKKAG